MKYMKSNNAEQQFASLGLSLPPAPSPLGVYKPYLIEGKYLYLSGHGPVQDDRSLIIGRIGRLQRDAIKKRNRPTPCGCTTYYAQGIE